MTFIEFRQNTISELRATAEELLLRPGQPFPKMEKYIEALSEVYGAYVTMVHASHASSSVAFAFRDLPAEEKANDQAAQHALNLLDRLYVEPTRPQAE